MTIDAEQQSSYDDFGVSSLVAPDTGTHTLACGDTSEENGITWVVVYNAEQSNAEGINTCYISAGGSFTCTPVTVSSGSMLVGGYKHDRDSGASVAAGAGLTILSSGEATSHSAYGIGATVFSMSGISSNGPKRQAAASYKEAGAPPAGRTRRMFVSQ